MSFVTTHPEALTAAAANLQTIGSALAAQNAAAATPTTGVMPAAADEVSALQATQFTAYGNLYQQISAQATAIHEAFVNTLGLSAGSYGETEAANSVAASSGSGLAGLLPSAAASGAPIFNGLTTQIGNFGSAASDLFEFGSAGLSAPGTGAVTGASAATVSSGGSGGAVLAGAAGPAGSSGAPVAAGIGQAPSVGRLSVPPSWAGATTAPSAPATLTGAGWTTAAPQTTSMAAMPAGMPAAGSAGRGVFGYGAPRYGVKPTVMPKPAVV